MLIEYYNICQHCIMCVSMVIMLLFSFHIYALHLCFHRIFFMQTELLIPTVLMPILFKSSLPVQGILKPEIERKTVLQNIP